MAGKSLTDNELLELVYKSDESFSDNSDDSVSSSDNEIDDVAIADAVIKDDSGDEEEILHQDFVWETMDNYTRHREVLFVILDPEMVQKM